MDIGNKALAHYSPGFQRSYSQTLCGQETYYCYRVRAGDTWKKLFPESGKRDIVKRVNRMNTPLRPGMTIAVPRQMEGKTAEDFSPFPRSLPWITEETVIFSLSKLYFAAYSADGRRVMTGPISGGRGCPGRNCLTPTGAFRFYYKRGANAVSSLYPIHTWEIVIRDGKEKRVPDRRGGASIPYFMAIVGHVGAHGFAQVPGFNASAGCVRMFKDDARRLNREFVRLGTKAIITNNIHSLPARPR
jgi:hypothetical protein